MAGGKTTPKHTRFRNNKESGTLTMFLRKRVFISPSTRSPCPPHFAVEKILSWLEISAAQKKKSLHRTPHTSSGVRQHVPKSFSQEPVTDGTRKVQVTQYTLDPSRSASAVSTLMWSCKPIATFKIVTETHTSGAPLPRFTARDPTEPEVQQLWPSKKTSFLESMD